MLEISKKKFIKKLIVKKLIFTTNALQ